jgi:hypothetical protein
MSIPKTLSFSILKTSALESMHPKILHPYTSIYKTLPTINEILMYLLTNFWYLDKTMTDQILVVTCYPPYMFIVYEKVGGSGQSGF